MQAKGAQVSNDIFMGMNVLGMNRVHLYSILNWPGTLTKQNIPPHQETVVVIHYRVP